MRNLLFVAFFLSALAQATVTTNSSRTGKGGGGGGTWGSITGTLSAQTDLNTQLGLLAPIDSPTFTTFIKFGNYHVEPAENDSGNSGTTKTINWATNSTQKSTLTGSVTYTFSNPVTGGTYMLRVNTGAGSFTTTWPGTVHWAGGVAPVTTVTATKEDLYTFYYNGASYLGAFSQAYDP